MKKFTLIFCLILSNLILNAQDFIEGNFTFSSKKISYLTLKDGSEVQGYIDDIDRKKGLIEEITIKDESGKKTVYKPEQIDHMYIAPNAFDKLGSGLNKMTDATKWEKDSKLNASHIKEGYALFETSEVMIKKDKKVLLLQLLNPAFASKIRVYFDPLAKETTSFGVGGLTVAGGDAKSYYVKKGDRTAFKLEKKNYEEELDFLYKDCNDYVKKLSVKDKIKWTDLSKTIFKYTNECN